MCGILAGIARPGRYQHADLRRAVGTLAHRGPDDLGVERVHATDAWELWMAHTRLSILDLSEAGHQPMHAEHRERGGWIVFNGEVYGHRELRPELEATGHGFRSTSDTEVLLRGLLEHGPGFLDRTNGMLAAAYFDQASETLLVARDRLGKKPVYIYESPDALFFASELKAFVALGLTLTEDAESLAYYHWLQHIPFERTIYKECQKLPAASFTVVDLRCGERVPLKTELFWDPLAAMARSFEGTYDDALDRVEELLDDATRIRLDADVPVGVFLSGGIDSSLVASSVARQHAGDVKAFIVKAADPQLDESERAVRTARQLGLSYEVLDLQPADYQRQIEKIPDAYDEPCAPFSQIPTLAISEAARKHVTVVLTGDGGDEGFVGYPWYDYPERLFRYRRPLDLVPGARAIASLVLPSRLGTLGLHVAVRALGLNAKNIETKREIAFRLLRAPRPTELYDHFQELQPMRALDSSDRAVLGPAGILERAVRAYPRYDWAAAESRAVPELLAALELVTSMRDEILVKVDRATMAYSLEARSPLLDHRMVELGMSLPISHKARDGVHKRVLRDVCARRIDRDLATRRKSGFGVPLPDDLPPGPTPAVRWMRAVECAWRQRWRGSPTGMAERT